MASKVVEQEVQENEIDLFGALVEGADPEDMLDALLDAMDAEDAPEVQEGWKSNVAGAVLGTAGALGTVYASGDKDKKGLERFKSGGEKIARKVVDASQKVISAPGRIKTAIDNRRLDKTDFFRLHGFKFNQAEKTGQLCQRQEACNLQMI